MMTGSGTRDTAGSAARELLDEVVRRWRTHVRRQVVTRLASGVAVVCLAGWAVDRFVPGATRAIVVVTLATLAASAIYVAWQIWSRRTVPRRRDLARFVEDHWPPLEDRLVTAVDVLEAPDSVPGGLVPRMLADADRAVSSVPLDAILPHAILRRSGLRAVAALAALAVACALWVEPGRRALQTAVLQVFPGRFALAVSPGDARVKPGEAFTITARAAAPFGSLAPTLEVAIGDERRSVTMRQQDEETFSWTFDRVPSSFAYRVTAPGRSSDRYDVTLLELPRVQRIDLDYAFPAYTRLAPRREEDGGDIFAPAGTRVNVAVHVSKPLESAALALADGGRLELKPTSPNTAEGELVVRSDGAYRVALSDRDGLRTGGETEYFIRVLDDRPPNVRIVRPASDRKVTALEEVTIEARADDDYGIASFDLVFSVRGGAEQAVPLADVTRRLPTATGRRTLYLEDLGVEPGDFVSYYARARDIGRGKAASEARSDIFFLEVTPFEEEFAAAQSQAMAAAGGDQAVDDLISAQKQIIVATWKLERRSAAGRSAADVDAVARAQGELRARAARLAQRPSGPPGRRRGNPFGLQPGAADSRVSSMEQAVGAMGRAETSLKARKTREAIPPEMEALNHLLKAQAEIRRREVMRQQASGFGSGNRAEQDLSALFDRELRRQQQTNYETPRTTEERREEKGDDVLERVRELARRQEQLARQQDELARERERMTEEERRRRLERLAREQAELRRLTEQAAQQATQPSASASAQPQDGKGQSARSALRDASEQMRQAASDLRREATDQARARAQQALDRLRSLERTMEGVQPDEQRRALGDLQLEARQMAERQRRLSEQAGAAGSQGDPASERRRLAGEQDRMAERAGRMQDRLRGLGEESAAGEMRDEARGAAAAVDEQQLVRRMREAARTLRDAASQPAKAEADRSVSQQGQEIARQLEGLAERLEAGGADRRDADQQRLASELAEARRLREELGDLQRRMGELQRADRRPSPQGESRQGSQAGRQSAQGSEGGELTQLQQEYAARARELSRLEQRSESRQDGLGMSTPEGQAPSVSAPGTEAFKQDFSGWERLHKDVTMRLERLEATLSQRMLERAARERVQAGAADTTPEEYEQAVDRYFRSLAKPEASTP